MTDTRSEETSERRRPEPSRRRTGLLLFLRQVIAELRKVVWPTRKQLITYFIVVLIFVMVMIAIVSVLDLALGWVTFRVFG